MKSNINPKYQEIGCNRFIFIARIRIDLMIFMINLIFIFSLSLAFAQEDPRVVSPGFVHCAPPLRPVCGSRPETFRDPTVAEACRLEISQYLETVFAYRACLDRETRRAVGEANDTAGEFRCRLAGRKRCTPRPAARPQPESVPEPE
jgi:hypothetical protein